MNVILGIGGASGIDTPMRDGDTRSEYLVREWGYPPVGVVLCVTPSGGHDTVMLEYSGGGPEPAVAYVDEDRVPRRIAGTFAEFLENFFECPEGERCLP